MSAHATALDECDLDLDRLGQAGSHGLDHRAEKYGLGLGRQALEAHLVRATTLVI